MIKRFKKPTQVYVVDTIMQVDPYKLLQVPKNFTIEQLKTQYKRIALDFHPDKHTKNPDAAVAMFQVLTNCYKQLVEEYRLKIADKQYIDMKHDFKNYTEQTLNKQLHEQTKFNISKFNTVFEKSRLNDITDDGYEKWMKSAEHSSLKDAKTEIVEYRDPQPVFGSAMLNNVYELGINKISDFSADNLSSKDLQFMDYRKAHTTTKIVDPDTVKTRKEYATVGELEADRGTISFKMSDEEYAELVQRKHQEDIKEKARMYNINKRDELIFKNFHKAQNMYLR